MKKIKTKCMIQKIESGGTGLGIPDLFFRTLKQDGWIELKRIKWPSTNSTEIKIPFEPGQFSWIKTYRELGGKVFLMCLVNSKTENDKSVFIFIGENIFKEYNQASFHLFADLVLNYDNFDYHSLYNLLNKE